MSRLIKEGFPEEGWKGRWVAGVKKDSAGRLLPREVGSSLT